MDVHRAIRESRLQFLGMRDFAESVPGADHHPDLTSRLGVTYVQGSSDTADKAMQDAAWEYCQIYNGLLLRHLRSNGSANPPATGGTPTADSAKRSDPAADAQQAISRRDFRFLGIQKLGEYILGVQDRPDLTSRYGVIYLVGTRKFADADTEDAVREYCQTYNLLLVRYLRTAGRSDWSGASHQEVRVGPLSEPSASARSRRNFSPKPGRWLSYHAHAARRSAVAAARRETRQLTVNSRLGVGARLRAMAFRCCRPAGTPPRPRPEVSFPDPSVRPRAVNRPPAVRRGAERPVSAHPP
eukprot:TRINITY_DN1852_c0_g1_i2.p1 TRINITY_DN1852_c0_g1~~TRINITY_DN1852_c0_g1_i2.p1  ORF type:complete len:299 (-),score=-37.68 TRINITY_DN1852_c0_g1_i2:246-1142(-)